MRDRLLPMTSAQR